jgi:hypothetical protein
VDDPPFELLERTLSAVEVAKPLPPEARIKVETGQQRLDWSLED